MSGEHNNLSNKKELSDNELIILILGGDSRGFGEIIEGIKGDYSHVYIGL